MNDLDRAYEEFDQAVTSLAVKLPTNENCRCYSQAPAISRALLYISLGITVSTLGVVALIIKKLFS